SLVGDLLLDFGVTNPTTLLLDAPLSIPDARCLLRLVPAFASTGQPSSRFGQFHRREILNINIADAFSRKHQRPRFPSFFCDKFQPLDLRIELHLSRKISPIAPFFPAFESLRQNQQARTASLLKRLRGGLLR